MSRGFRDSDATQELTGREAGEVIERVRAEGVRQASHAAELREMGASGVCEMCGGAIGEERLAAVPDATRCISCQTTWEGH